MVHHHQNNQNNGLKIRINFDQNYADLDSYANIDQIEVCISSETRCPYVGIIQGYIKHKFPEALALVNNLLTNGYVLDTRKKKSQYAHRL